ncbi:MAG: NUDIX hydrolase [Acidimicrobiales bacterium]
MAVPLREAVRAVVTDTEARLLLVRFGFGEAPLWATPGGGVEHGESDEAAIRRELHEEVGLHDVEVGPAIWTRTHIFPLSSEFGGQRETFYLVRVQRITGSPALSDQELLAEGLTGSRWWTLAELKDSVNGRFAPRRLADLYESLLSNGPPQKPMDAGE